jgi:hypothetical protein
MVVYTLTLVAATLAKKNPTHPFIQRLKLIINPLSDARVTMRVLGTFSSLEYALAPEANQTTLDFIQNASMLVFHPAELLYWLGAHRIWKIPQEVSYKWSRISCMAWVVWIVADIISATKSLRKAEKLMIAGNTDRTLARAQVKDLRLRLVAQLADFPMAVHWSLASYPLPEWWVGFFGFIGSIAGGWRTWRASAL